MTHPKVALNNAKQHFEIGKREEDMIVKHMWPLTLKFPKYAESYVIVCIDKYTAMLEIGSYLGQKMKEKRKQCEQNSIKPKRTGTHLSAFSLLTNP